MSRCRCKFGISRIFRRLAKMNTRRTNRRFDCRLLAIPALLALMPAAGLLRIGLVVRVSQFQLLSRLHQSALVAPEARSMTNSKNAPDHHTAPRQASAESSTTADARTRIGPPTFAWPSSISMCRARECARIISTYIRRNDKSSWHFRHRPPVASSHFPGRARKRSCSGQDPAPISRARTFRPRPWPGLPGEFADYFRGSIAWHQGDLPRPGQPGSRRSDARQRSDTFQVRHGRLSCARVGRKKPRPGNLYFQNVRELTAQGFADSSGLAASSLGWEARLHWRDRRFAQATDLYLEQAAAGDPTAKLSLRFVGSRP